MQARTWILSLPLMLGGCSVMTKIEVFNETGHTVEVLLDKQRWVLGSSVVRVRPDRMDKARLYDLRKPGLRLRAGDCEYVYALPSLRMFNSRYVAHVRADFTIVGFRERWMPSDLEPELTLRPVSKTCGRQAAGVNPSTTPDTAASANV